MIEDSPSGVRAGVAAGMNVIAFATPFTIKGLHDSKVLGHDRILHDSDELLKMVRQVVQEHERAVHGNDPGKGAPNRSANNEETEVAG